MKKIRFFLSLTLCCITLGAVSAQVQPITVTGYIIDESGHPIAGATVSVKEGAAGAVSDRNGYYLIRSEKGTTLVYAFPGYLSQEHPTDRVVINIQLLPDESALDERVVSDNGRQKTKKIVHTAIQEEREEIAYDWAPQPSGTVVMNLARIEPLPIPGVRFDRREREEYAHFTENRFVAVGQDPLSTFSLDVDGASYSNMRRMVNRGQLPSPDMIRTEELVNYFLYDYEKPQGNDPIRISYEIATCPWNRLHRLVRVGIKARELIADEAPASNFVFLIDVSGSMYGPSRLELVKSSLKLLVNNLREQDRVAIVVYAGAAGTVLPSTPGSDKQKIREALDQLTAGGSTAGGAGIRLAYQIARQNFAEGGNNRIILCTDGDFNVGISSTRELESLIEQERRSGVFLTVLGYGMGNYKEEKMQVLAQKGNGNHAYIDNIQEANRVLVQEFGGTMYTVAKDVKLQIEFNPSKVQAYRLIGYETRLLEHEDFNDDRKDAGEIGAGHSVTAFYEVIPVGVEGTIPGSIDPLKYQTVAKAHIASPQNRYPDLMTIKLRYKEPGSEVSKLLEVPVIDRHRNTPSADYQFAAAVAMFGQLLRNSDFKGEATYSQVVALARQGLGKDEHGYRREFIRLAESVKGMAPQEEIVLREQTPRQQ